MGREPVDVDAMTVRPLSGADEEALLDAIDARLPSAAALTLLLGRCAAAEDQPLGAAADRLTIGEREALALRLRAATLPGPMVATMACTSCGAIIEMDFDPAAMATEVDRPVRRAVIAADGYRLECRPVTGEDQRCAAFPASDDEALGRALLARCVTVTDASGAPVTVEALPRALAERAAACVLSLDPGAETTLEAICPSCGAAVSGSLDAGGFVLAELARRASALPAQILAIARATGWDEGSILAMPPARRHRYAALLAPGGAA
ncbi:hypothetical protein [Elioraea sp.]|uniref:hypothetical protein n=1 Tax=Elioraea sp. TaxID=2185103 RepID=UPI003F6F094F